MMLHIKNVQIIGENNVFPGELLVKDGKIA